MKRPIAAAAMVALAACAVGPKYERPQLPTPKDYRIEIPPEQAASIADLPWWEMFKDPTLQALIKEALQANQDLALATARVEEARALAGVARADFWPQLAAEVNPSYGQLVPKSGLRELGLSPPGGPSAHWRASLGLSWEIDIWGRVRNATAAAVADLMATEDARRGVIITLIADVAQAYVELRQLDLQLEISERNRNLRQGTLDLFVTRAEGGVGNDLEVSQARADLAVTAAAIPASRRLIALMENQLSVLLGRPPGPIPRGGTEPLPLPPELPPGVPASLLERRPDVLAAEQAAIAANARVGVAIANRLPSLSLAGIVGLGSPMLSSLFSENAFFWSVGGSLLAPIFQGGRLASAQDAAVARFQESVASYRQTVLTAFREVSDAAVSVRQLTEVRQEKEKQVTAARAAAELALMRYEGGVSSYLEVLDAQRSAYQAELDLNQATRDELVNAVLLYRALGGGWQAPRGPQGGAKGAAPLVTPAMAMPKAAGAG